MLETLSNLSELRNSRFGQPDPRHGLRLLWWFAHVYVHVDSNGLHTKHDPKNGHFGFRHFRNVEKILPINHEYYETGNLRTSDALPHYVTENYTGNSDDRNTDRLIVSVCSRLNGKVWLQDVYVTQHSGLRQFDRNRTYRISPDLIEEIKNLNRAEFLTRMKIDQNSFSIQIEAPENLTHVQQRSFTYTNPYTENNRDCKTCCTLLFALFIVLLLIGLVYFLIRSVSK